MTLRAERGRRFLAPAVPGAVGAVDVVEAGDGRLEAALGPVLLADDLREELLPAVAALGVGRVGVGFLEGPRPDVLLQVDVVGAGGGGEEVAVGAGPLGGLDHVRVDEDRAQALDAVALDEAHAAHVGGQVVDLDRPLAGPGAVVADADVEDEVLDAGGPLVPLVEGLLVDGPDAREALVVEVADERPGDEAAGPGDDEEVVPFPEVFDPLGRDCGHGLSFRVSAGPL